MSVETSPPPGVTHEYEGTTERISWRNHQLPRNKWLYVGNALGLILFLPLTLFLLYQVVREQLLSVSIQIEWASVLISSIFILLFGLVVYVSAAKLISLSWREEIEIDDDTIFLRNHGPFSGKERRIKVADVWRLSFEKYQHNQEQEFRYSVNIFHKRREQIAYWMKSDEGRQLYNLLGDIIKRRGWDGLIKIEERGYQPKKSRVGY